MPDGLPTSGPISLSDISNEFGNIIDGGDFLSEYWGAAANIPKRGQQISISDFYGAVNLQMTVTLSNTDPTTELVASDSGRSYVPPASVLITTATAAEFSYSQQGSGRGYSTWYRYYGTSNQSGPYYQIDTEIKESDAGTVVPITEYMTSSNAADYDYSSTSTVVDGHKKYTTSNAAYPAETWVSETSPYEMKTRTVTEEEYGVETAVTAGNAGTSDYWLDTAGIKYVITSPDTNSSPDRNGYRQWRIDGTATYYWALDSTDSPLTERTGTQTTINVTPDEAPYMGYVKSDPEVVEDGNTKWTKGDTEYWNRSGIDWFYTREDIIVNHSDVKDENNYWKIEKITGSSTPYKLTVSLNGYTVTSYHTTEPTTTTTTIRRLTVTRGSQRTEQAWSYDYKDYSSGDAYDQYWRVGNYYPFWYSLPKEDPIPADAGTFNAVGPGGVSHGSSLGPPGNIYTSLFGEFYDDAMTMTEHISELNGKLIKRGDFVKSTSGLYASNYYKLGEPYNIYPAIWGISAEGTIYNYTGPVRDTKTTYTYSDGITDEKRETRTVYTYSDQLQLTRNITTYQYSSIYETRPEVLAISATPQFTYDDARQALYRLSTTTASYPTKLDWPISIAYSYNWKNQRTINNYYLVRMEVDGSLFLEVGTEILTASGTLINAGNNTPQRLTFTPNPEAAREELTDYFFTLYRNDAGSSAPINLGYVAPMNGGYPTMALSGNTLVLGNLAANETFRLKWYGIQGAKLSAAGGAATGDGVTSPFTSTGIPSLTISGGDDGRRGFDLYLERKVNTSPDAWAVIRSWEFFQDSNKSNLFGSSNYQIAACDFLDIYKFNRS